MLSLVPLIILSCTRPVPTYLNQSRLFPKTMQKQILTQVVILRGGSGAKTFSWPYHWLLFCRCDWHDSDCWGKQIKTCQCSRWTDVDGGFDVSLDDSFCNVSSFSFPNIEYFFCCFETQIFAISSWQIFWKCSRICGQQDDQGNSNPLMYEHISLLWKVLCHL